MTCKDCMSYDTETGFCKTCGAAVGMNDPKCSAYAPESLEEYAQMVEDAEHCIYLIQKGA